MSFLWFPIRISNGFTICHGTAKTSATCEMIKLVVQRRVGIATIEVAGHHATNVIRKQNTNGQTKQDAFSLCTPEFPASLPNSTNHAALCGKPSGLEKIPQPDNFKNMYCRQDGAD